MKWSDKVNWGTIPERMRGGVIRYVEQGIPPGHFLQALFEDSLVGAVKQADSENVRLLREYADLLSNQCPALCWGSPGDYRQWIGRGGINGNDKHEPLPVHQWGRWADQEYR
jgi:hypothetical protein